jgi:hypothetical protein
MKAMRDLALDPNQTLRLWEQQLYFPSHLQQIKHRTPTRSATW